MSERFRKCCEIQKIVLDQAYGLNTSQQMMRFAYHYVKRSGRGEGYKPGYGFRSSFQIDRSL
ncbi:MAG: hypothetical protein QXO55_07300 [Candidatus Korarchaeum sp.]